MKNSYSTSLTPIQKMRLALMGVAGVLVIGTVGFMSLEDMSLINALYMTIITLSTVGFGEVRPLHANSRIFVILLIVFGVALLTFTMTVLAQLVLEGQFKEFFGRKKMESRIKKMKNHYIIAGFGRVGRQVSKEFQREKIPFIVIEQGGEAIEHLISDGIIFVQGDSTDEDVLTDAGIKTAKALISTLPDEAQNVYLTLTARDMNRDLKIIARADYEAGEKKLLRAGANHVVIPHILGGIRMAMASLRPNVTDFMKVTTIGEGGLSIEEMVITDNCLLAGKSLVDSKLKENYKSTVIGIKHSDENMTIVPPPETVLKEGDILVLIGPTDKLYELSDDLSG